VHHKCVLRVPYLTYILVPIYDGRKAKVDVKHIINKLAAIPSYHSELPQSSCAAVAYTINTYTRKNDDMKSLSFNIQWAMMLGKQ